MRCPLLITVFILLGFSSCKDLKEPVFNGIQNVRVNNLKQGKSMMVLDMSYFNPNNINAKLKEAEGEAWLDSTYLGRFKVDSSVKIPANSNFIVPVKLDVEMKHLLKHSMAVLMNEQVLLTIKGKAKVGKTGFYRKIPLHYEGKQNLQELFK
ncbi:MAG TPA: LEA type 2 family protein [Chitinophagaceae bacterium]